MHAVFNGLVARFLMFAAMYKIQKWITFGHFWIKQMKPIGSVGHQGH